MTMAYILAMRKFAGDFTDAWIGIIKIILSVIWATYRKIIQSEERTVSSDLILAEKMPVKINILITGAGHGIGKELARQYGLLGATVICVDVNEAANEKTVKELKQLDVKAYGYTCDVSNRQAVLALATQVRKEVGFVTILVNNAGIMPCKKLRHHTEQDINKIFDINVFAQFWTLEAFLPAMISNDYGHIVALSSIAGLGGYPNLVPYCSSKFAVRGLMDGLKAEMRQERRSINFTTVYPFMVDTGLCKNPRIGFPTLLGMQRPEDVASRIISAQRRGFQEVSVPFHLQWLSNLERLLPDKAKDLIDDSLQTGADPHS